LILGIAEGPAEEGPVEIDREVAHLAGEVDRLDDVARFAVTVGGIAVDIGREVPDAGAEFEISH
jgi:hypothetical protein